MQCVEAAGTVRQSRATLLPVTPSVNKSLSKTHLVQLVKARRPEMSSRPPFWWGECNVRVQQQQPTAGPALRALWSGGEQLVTTEQQHEQLWD